MSESQTDSATGRIIFVDRDNSMREMMEMLLQCDQHAVVTLSTAEEGLSMLKAEGVFDIVISSFILPGMNGLEFLRQVSLNHPATVRILMTGGSGDAFDVKRALNKGHINRLALKPLCFGTIREQLKKDLASSRSSEIAN
jgi:DNA-binding NtrC family response regulator